MELKTKALDRVLEALSPTLGSELERVVKETSEKLELEFERRLQDAVKEAQAAVQNEAVAELRRSVEETREQTRKQVSEELEQQFKKSLDETTKHLKSEWDAERTRIEEQLAQWRVLADAQRQFAGASTQAEILARFMKLAEPFAAGLAVYVTRADGLALWKCWGEAVFPEIISEGTADPESYFRTILVRGKTVAAVCASRPRKIEIVDFLVSSVERAIEVFGMKLTTPLLKPAGGSGAGSEQDQKAHGEARRTARLLISEIKLYNEEELKAGRENNDIYRRLQHEIDRGRETYTQRVPGKVSSNRDYYHEALVRILGEDDLARLGDAYPGPVNSR